jgi:hypothetical protein
MRRALVLLTAVLAALLMLVTPSSAHWTASGAGAGAGTTGTLAAPTAVSVAANSLPSVAVSWIASAGSPTPTGYAVTRTSGGISVAACAGSLVTGTSCTDTAVPDGTYTYTVTAVFRSWTATSAPSGSVSVWTPARLAVTGQPTTTIAGTAINPPVAVTVQTAAGVGVPLAGRPVTIAIGTNPGDGALSGTLSGTTDVGGVATFGNLSIDRSGTGYTLVATSAGLTSATSGAFTVSAAAADRFAITSTAVSGSATASPTLGPITIARDVYGNAVNAPPGGTVVNLASNSTGTARFAATSGGATITAVTIPAGSSSVNVFYGDTKAGSPVLTAAGTLASATQTATINAGAPSKFAFISAPVSAAATISATLGPLTVQRQDGFGNAAAPATVETVTPASNSTGTAFFSSTFGGTATTTVTIPANAAAVSFFYSDTKPGTPTITASGALTSATQVQTIVVGPAAKLALTGSIDGTASATAVSGPVTVQVRDVADNPVTTGAVVALSSNSAGTPIFATTAGGASIALVTIPAGSSTATFYYGDTKATGAGTVTVTAAAGGLTGTTLGGAIAPAAATQLQFGQQPTNTAKSATITPAVTARILDQFSNLTTSTASVTIAIENNPPSLLGLTAGTLNGTKTVTAVAGVASFNNIRIDGGILNLGGEGNGYTLKVTSTGLTAAISAPFNIT